MSKIVTNGAKLQCNCGSAPGTLNTSPSSARADGGYMASIMDHAPGKNISGFRTCSKKDNKPCSPATDSPWKCSNSVMLDGKPALTEDGVIKCKIGGTITVMDSGQKTSDAGLGRSIDMSGFSVNSHESHTTSASDKYFQKHKASSESSKAANNYTSLESTLASPSTEETMRGMYWPPYDPLKREDLSDKFRELLEANHKKAIILTPEDAHKTLLSMWEEQGTAGMKVLDKLRDYSSHGNALYKSYELVKQFGSLGVATEVFTMRGKEYIAITTKNNSSKVLRHVLVNGVRVKLNGKQYRVNNPKIIQLGLAPQSRVQGFKGEH